MVPRSTRIWVSVCVLPHLSTRVRTNHNCTNIDVRGTACEHGSASNSYTLHWRKMKYQYPDLSMDPVTDNPFQASLTRETAESPKTCPNSYTKRWHKMNTDVQTKQWAPSPTILFRRALLGRQAESPKICTTRDQLPQSEPRSTRKLILASTTPRSNLRPN